VDGIFVGRTQELAGLNVAFDEARRGRGRLLLLTGEAGIGKTRLCDELARATEARGARVLWGRCWEGGGAPAYWPWIQALRAHIRGSEPHRLEAQLGGGAADVAQIIPEVAARLEKAFAPSTLADDPRFRAFDATTEFLANVASEQPLLIVLDDLQEFDESSLLLLQFVARSLRRMRAVIVGTHRDPQIGHATAPLLGDLLRDAQCIRLRGLDANEIETLINGATGGSVVAAPGRSLALANAIHTVTEGNPFFIDAVLRLLIVEGRLASGELPTPGKLAIPQEIHVAVRTRLQSLSPPARDLLATAAVLGREFHLRVLESMRPDVPLRELMREADRAGILTRGGDPSSCTFSHALIREVLYEGLPLSLRAELHRAAAATLENIHCDDPDHFSSIAHHLLLAAAGSSERSSRQGDIHRSALYATLAGHRAVAMLAYEEGASCYERALQALDLGEPQDRRRCELLLACGDACRKAGDSARSRATFLRAADVARRLLAAGEPQARDLLARAALGLGTKGFWGPTAAGEVDHVLVALLEESLTALGPHDSVRRAQVLACLAVSLYWSPERWQSLADLGAEAVAIAERVGDPVTQLICLASRHIVDWNPDNVAERTAAAQRMLQLAPQLGHSELHLFAYAVHLADVLETGNIDAARSDVVAFGQLAEQLRLPHYLWWLSSFRTTLASLAGRLDDAERLAAETLALGQEIRPTDAAQVFGVIQFTLCRGRGGLDDLALAVESLSEQHRAIAAWRCGFALLLAELGRSAEAQRQLDDLASDDFAALRRDLSWLVSMSLLAETAAILGDRKRAARLYALLLPYADRVVVIGYGYGCWGALSRHLGRLAATLMHWEAAEHHFEQALRANEQLGSRPSLASTQIEYAEMLLQRAASDDSSRARALIEAALLHTRECGMSRLEQQAQRLLSADHRRSIERREPEPPASSQPLPQSMFKLVGDYWTIAHGNVEQRLKDSKGLRCIHELLAHPSLEFHAIDLAGIGTTDELAMKAQSDELVKGYSAAFRDTGELLDAKGRIAYRERARDLRSDLEEAERLNDLGRADRVRCELEIVIDKLGAAFGRGQARRSGSAAERARVNVTKLIGAAIQRIGTNDPTLGRYFATTISTGTFCSYTPDPSRPLRWEL
jgi:tetratricopeptide (TPR) repeat protein